MLDKSDSSSHGGVGGWKDEREVNRMGSTPPPHDYRVGLAIYSTQQVIVTTLK